MGRDTELVKVYRGTGLINRTKQRRLVGLFGEFLLQGFIYS